MAWVKPIYSKERVKKAGMVLSEKVKDDSRYPSIDESYEILSNWRSSHSYPVNTFQACLRAKLGKLGVDATVAQRLKRIPSIINKLSLNPDMSLSRMQDIGGLRAVVPTMEDLIAVWQSFGQSRFEHQLVGEKNYIAEPKGSGYRGVHLIYKYKNRKGSGPDYEGLQVEIQLRDKVQHAWATAVETAGLFLDQALKSSIGNARWLEFFSLASSSFALMEGAQIYAGHRGLAEEDVFRRTFELEEELQVGHGLRMYNAAINHNQSEAGKFHYFLMEVDPKARTGTIRQYMKGGGKN